MIRAMGLDAADLLPADAPVTCAIALGSNLGDPVDQLERALAALDHLPGTRLVDRSGLYGNPPMGPQDQPDYVNAVALITTRLRPEALLRALKALEQAAGRQSTRHWGERILDLDILTIADQVIDMPDLQVPHPGIADRRFVLAPWFEIAPEARLPDGRTIRALLDATPDHPLRCILPRPDDGLFAPEQDSNPT
jgi:2-amino-4-hydroxy-6-hydroxymethyldihydropteridine diphosphokinase